MHTLSIIATDFANGFEIASLSLVLTAVAAWWLVKAIFSAVRLAHDTEPMHERSESCRR